MFRTVFILLVSLLLYIPAQACSVLYYIDKQTGKIYVANHEDYWYKTKAYLQIEPRNENELARLWYGWDQFAQGGINEAGLFFDGAVTPEQPQPTNYNKPKGNLGDELLAQCHNVKEAITFIKEKNLILHNAHMMLGDSSGHAVVLEWLDDKLTIVPIQNNHLLMTNYLLSDTTKGNYPCYRYGSILANINKAERKGDTVNFLQAANFIGSAAQPEQKLENGKTGGTLYSTFINISDMQLVVSYKLNKSVTTIDLRKYFAASKRKKIVLK